MNVYNAITRNELLSTTFETELFGREQEEDFENFLDIIDVKNPNFYRYVNETKID